MFIAENLLVLLEVSGIKSVDADEFGTVTSSFTTRMNPLLATVNDVRRRIGAHIGDIKDDTIAQLNFRNTQAAFNLQCGCDTSDPIWLNYANRWVTLLTSLTLLDNSEAFTSATSGSVSKVLGDFEISKTGPSSRGGTNNGFQNLIDRLECELFKIEIAVRLCQKPRSSCGALTNATLEAADYNPSLPALTIKGICDPNYPLTGRRWARGPIPAANSKVKAFGRWYRSFIHDHTHGHGAGHHHGQFTHDGHHHFDVSHEINTGHGHS